MDFKIFENVSGYEELEIFFAVNGLNDEKRNVLDKIFNYRNDSVYCIPTAGGFVWYSRDSLKRIDPPIRINWNFDCSDGSSLVSLKGCPKEVGGDFFCSRCKALVSLDGCPKNVGGSFDCSYCDSLVSLKGCPEKIGANFYCFECRSLKLYDFTPKHVGGRIYC